MLTDEQIITIAQSIFGRPCDICLSGRGERDREVTVEEYPIGEDAIAFARAILDAAGVNACGNDQPKGGA
jgi:hypothetical protein